MTDIVNLIAKVKNQRMNQMIKKKYHCEKCNKSIIKLLPKLYSGVPQCSCGEQMQEV